jgi:murein DD-endopeptidase MepM/ murein hydrolase activator NlpD
MMRYRFFMSLLAAASLAASPFGLQTTQASSVDELQAQLNEKKNNLQNIQDKVQQFQQQIQQKKTEARTLQDQIGIIDDNIEATQLNLDQTEAQIEETSAQINSVQADIQAKEDEIAKDKELLMQYLRSLQELDQQSTVTIFLKYQTFSEALNEAATVQDLQDRAHATLVAVEKLRDDLMTKQRELQDYQQTLQGLQQRQEGQKKTLEGQKASKKQVLSLTNAQEAQFNSLLKQAQASQKQAEADISHLDTLIREQLREQGYGNLPSVGTMSWPIEPIFGISCGFHCPGYPYAYLIGPHSGIDIPTYVGTPIKAPADGYVASTHDSGGPGYSYILILHGDNISTVYGHVSGFAVKEGQRVTRGQVIGYTGGAAGAHGSGLSSGPHLHFEVRVKNVPTDPMNFLGAR